MKRGATFIRHCAITALAWNGILRADEPTVEALVELPPIEVTTLEKAPRWHYAAVPGAEVLSRCDAGPTTDFLEAQHRLHEILATVLPEDMRVHYDVPVAIILAESNTTPTTAHDMVTGFAQLKPTDGSGKDAGREGQAALIARNIRFLPNLRLDDFDSAAVFAIIDEHQFKPNRMTLTKDLVRVLLSRRTPTLPEWLVEGFVQVFADMRLGDDTIKIDYADWISPAERESLRTDDDYPRALLPMKKLLEAPRPNATLTPEAAQIWRAQSALLVRWALDGGEVRRTGFWKFVRRIGVTGADEAAVRDCLGLSYADLRDRLSDYLPIAIGRPAELRVGEIKPMPKVKLRLATPLEIARLKGDWERLAMEEVKRRHPRYVGRYSDQAYQTLTKGYESAPEDAPMLAVIGLYECDTGNDAVAQLHLETAAKLNIVRPRVYFELARIRYAAAIANPAAKNGRLSADQVESAWQPLRVAWRQAPPFAETYMLATDLCSQQDAAVSRQQWDRVKEGLRLFPRNAGLLYFAAKLQLVRGSPSAAATLIERALQTNPPPALQARLAELRSRIGSTNAETKQDQN